MRKALFLSTALGAAALLGSPALAESSWHKSSSSAAPLGMQQQSARQADGMAGQREASGLLQQADQAAARGQWARANELIERAQTARLNEHVLSGGAASPGSSRAFEDARQAIASRDRAGARSALQSAMSDTGRDSYTGSGSGFSPAQGGSMGDHRSGSSLGHSSMSSGGGGGGMSGYGSSTMRDSGMGDRSMSRADHIILAQGAGGGGGGQGEGSGGLPGSTPGSPGVGTPGSTPRTMPGTAVQPGQTSAGQGSMSSTTGPGAPAPGSLTPAPGVTDGGSRTTTGSGGANPPSTGGSSNR